MLPSLIIVMTNTNGKTRFDVHIIFVLISHDISLSGKKKDIVKNLKTFNAEFTMEQLQRYHRACHALALNRLSSLILVIDFYRY